jgi:hypothetical protein
MLQLHRGGRNVAGMAQVDEVGPRDLGLLAVRGRIAVSWSNAMLMPCFVLGHRLWFQIVTGGGSTT